VVTSWDAFTGENFRRCGFLDEDQRYERARTFLQTTRELFDSWRGDEILADKDSGVFLSDPQAGAFAHKDATSPRMPPMRSSPDTAPWARGRRFTKTSRAV